jgi:hypothetical protein
VIAGGIGDTITKNRLVDNAKVGIALAPSVGLQAVPTPATGNQVTGNVVQGSGLADLAAILPGANDHNCFTGNTFTTSAPADIERAMPCTGAGTGDLTVGALDIRQFLDTSKNPSSAVPADAGAGEATEPRPRRARAGATGGGARRVGRGRDLSAGRGLTGGRV